MAFEGIDLEALRLGMESIPEESREESHGLGAEEGQGLSDWRPPPLAEQVSKKALFNSAAGQSACVKPLPRVGPALPSTCQTSALMEQVKLHRKLAEEQNAKRSQGSKEPQLDEFFDLIDLHGLLNLK